MATFVTNRVIDPNVPLTQDKLAPLSAANNLGVKNIGEWLKDTAVNTTIIQSTSGVVALTGNFINNNGDSRGTNITIGTNDNFNLNLETAGTTRVTITSSGNVGIGTTTPTEILAVSGNILASGNISTQGQILSAGVNIGTLFGTGGGNATTATALQTSRNLWGQPFNGTADITGSITTTGTINVSSASGVSMNLYGRDGDNSSQIRFYTASDELSSIIGMVGTDLRFYTGGPNIRMNITSSGNVGIGTTNPQTTLQINSTQPQSNVHPNRAGVILQGESDNLGGRLGLRTASTIEFPGILNYRSRGSLSALAAIQTNDQMGHWGTFGYDGTNWTAGGYIGYFASTNWSTTAGSKNSVLTFNTLTSGSETEKMRITSIGNVGIGTNNPSSYVGFRTTEVGDATTFGLFSAKSNNGNALMFCNAGVATFGSTAAYATTFITHSVERMCILSGGNVGIGTPSPTERLHIEGTLSSGNVRALIVNNAVDGYSTLALRNDRSGVWRNGTSQTAYGGANSLNIGTIDGDNVSVVTNNTTRMLITSAGDVGIGTINPTQRLVVAQSFADGCWFSGSSVDSFLGLGGYNSGSSGAFRLNYNRSSGVITFSGGTRDTPLERMRIDNSGGVLIGALSGTGFALTLREYSATNAGRNWIFRDDSGVNRLRLSRGSTDAAVYDVLKVAGSDAIDSQIWYTNGLARMSINNSGNLSANVLGTGTTTSRSLQDRFGEVINIKDYGAVGNGSTNDTAAFQAVLNKAAGATGNIDCYIPPGTYLLSTSPTEPSGGVKVNWIFDRVAQLSGAGSVVTNTGAGLGGVPYMPKKNQLGGLPVPPNIPKISLVDGSPQNPLTNTTYRTPAIYVERHTNSNVTAAHSDWGNTHKHTPILCEVIAYQSEYGEVNAFAGRVFSNQPKVAGGHPLVGISALAQSSSIASGTSRDVFGANFVASADGVSTTRPENIVGIEADVGVGANYIMPDAPPGAEGAVNATGYWAQTKGGQMGNAAFFSSRVITPTVSPGWRFGIYTSGNYYNWCALFTNSLNAPEGRGIRVQIQWGANTGTIFQGLVNTTETFRIDGNLSGNNSNVWLYVNGSLKNVEVGATDSGGAGYRMLRVLN